MLAAVPGGEGETGGGEDEGGGKLESVEATKAVLERQGGGMLGESHVDLDDAERWPLAAKRIGGGGASGDGHSTHRLYEADAAGEPSVGTLHCLA